MALTREQILNMNDEKTEAVFVKEWGDEVFVRSLTSKEREILEEDIAIIGGGVNADHNLRPKLVAMACVDENGEQLFTPEDLTALEGKNAVALWRIFRVAQRLSGLDAATVEELVGNSESIRSEDSPSDSTQS